MTKLFHFHGIFKKNETKSVKRYLLIHMNPILFLLVIVTVVKFISKTFCVPHPFGAIGRLGT